MSDSGCDLDIRFTVSDEHEETACRKALDELIAQVESHNDHATCTCMGKEKLLFYLRDAGVEPI